MRLPINAAHGFICHYPQVLFPSKVGVTLPTENRALEVFPFVTILPLSECERKP